MKNILLYILLIFFFACDNMGPGKRYPIEQSHGHNHKSYEEHSHDHEEDSGYGISSPIKDIASSEDNAFSSAKRDLWQRPNVVLSHLGNLKNKTMADVGAGPIGYFSFTVAKYTPVKKVLALDIDQNAIDEMEEIKKQLDKDFQDRIETRLVKPNDPLLIENEVDVILISSTLTFIDDKVGYLKNLREKLPNSGRLVIVDHKMKEIPEEFPPRSLRIPLYEMEDIIDKAGFKRIVTDDISLDFQYIIVALKP